jgi:hypothetical protein
LELCGFVTFCVALDAFAAKALRPEAFCFISFYWNGKGAKLRFGLVFISRKDTKALNFLLLLMLSVFLMPVLKTDALAPIVTKILLCRGSAQKIVVDSGK